MVYHFDIRSYKGALCGMVQLPLVYTCMCQISSVGIDSRSFSAKPP